MLSIKEIEDKLQCKLSEEKIEEINLLEEKSLANSKNNKIGNIYERLLVIGRAPSSNSSHPITRWWCICSCNEHNIVAVRTNNLTSGNTSSCGCLNKEKSIKRIVEAGHNSAKDLRGFKSGELTALYPTDERDNGSVVWVCKCSCGNICKVQAKELTRHSYKSCGHLSKSFSSFGSNKIDSILRERNISFQREKTFETCRFPDTKAKGKYDFYVEKDNSHKFLIEFDGKQHFEELDKNFFRDSLEKRQAHDKFKDKWAEENNIPLIRISYKEENYISIDLINQKLKDIGCKEYQL